MRFKLDETLGTRGRDLISGAGHDVATVPEQSLTSALDEKIFEVCAAEDRALVTLDLDFANPFRFPPASSAGIAVLRLSLSPDLGEIEALVVVLIRAIDSGEELHGRLWIVESERIRVYEPES